MQLASNDRRKFVNEMSNRLWRIIQFKQKWEFDRSFRLTNFNQIHYLYPASEKTKQITFRRAQIQSITTKKYEFISLLLSMKIDSYIWLTGVRIKLSVMQITCNDRRKNFEETSIVFWPMVPFKQNETFKWTSVSSIYTISSYLSCH